MFIGIGIGTGFLSGTGTGAIALTMSGLTDGEARPGNHGSISVAAPDGVTFVSQAWSVGATSYGTGSNPDDYTADDGGTLRWEATGDDSLTYRAFALIRRAVAVNTAAPVIQSTGTGLGDTITMTPGTWMGDAGGAFTERLFRDGEPLVVGSPTVSYEIDIADSEAVITGTREYTNSGGTTSVSVTGSVTVDDLVAVPDEFGDEDWEFVNGDDASTLEINILALPFDNGSEITDIEYRVDGGSAVSLGTTETGAYVLPGTVVGTEYDAEIRAVNGEGAGPWSSVKSATPAEAPDAFEVGDWTLTDLASGGDARVAISALPGSNGAELTQLDYRIDGGTWQLLTASPSVGNFDLLDVFTDGVEGDVEIRARNSAGIGDASDVKSVTTTLVTPTLNITSAVFTPGSGGNPASVETEVEEDSTTGPYTLFGATHANATTLTAANIENSTGDAEDTFSIGPEADVADLDDALSFSTTLPYGARMSFFIRDSAGTPKESDVFQIVNIEVDADAPTLSGGSPADNATDVAVDATPALTFSKPIFGVATKDFYLYEDIDTTPVLVETFTFDDATGATGDNGGSASISGAVIAITPGDDMIDGTQHSIRWEAGAVVSSWATPVAANTGDAAYNFTTAAAEAPAGPVFLGTQLVDAATGSSGLYSFTEAGLNTGKAILALHICDTGTNTVTSVTIAGVTASAISGAEGASQLRTKTIFYEADIGSGNTAIAVQMDANVARAIGVSVWLGNTSDTFPDTDGYGSAGIGVDEAMPLSLDVEDGDYILAASTFFDNTVEGQVYDDSENNGVSGVTRETIGFAEVTALGDACLIESYRHDVTADETRAISINKWDGAAPNRQSCAGLVVRNA
jgi:hypothetical protein